MPFYKNGRNSGLNLPWLERAVCWKRQEVSGILITHWNEASRALPVLALNSNYLDRWRLGGSEKAMGRCTARLKMLLFRAKTIVTDWGKVELSCLKKKENQFAHFASAWCGTFATGFRDARSLVGHENTRRWTVCGYKVYRFWDLERFFCISIYCVYVVSLQSLPTLWWGRLTEQTHLYSRQGTSDIGV